MSISALRRLQSAKGRTTASKLRSPAGDQRSRTGESHRTADERDRIADERERIADERERIADEREQIADSANFFSLKRRGSPCGTTTLSVIDAACETPSMGEIDPGGTRKDGLDAFLDQRIAEGYLIETRTDTHAIISRRPKGLKRLR